MVRLKKPAQIEQMRVASQLTAQTQEFLREQVRSGISTAALDSIADTYIRDHGGRPSPKGYRGYPNSICMAVNDVVVHGVPTDHPLKDGDILTMDVTIEKGGYHGDKAITVKLGDVSEDAEKLIAATEEAMYRGIVACHSKNRVGDIGVAVQDFVEELGYSVVREFCGHGIGEEMHEEPQIMNYGRPRSGHRLKVGMVITVEPMVNIGTHMVQLLPDGWTAVTADGSLSCQFEHTVAITPFGPDILTIYTDHERKMWERFSNGEV
jgi:methionyl aminopeptidase